jgi:hypothetical protein
MYLKKNELDADYSHISVSVIYNRNTYIHLRKRDSTNAVRILHRYMVRDTDIRSHGTKEREPH